MIENPVLRGFNADPSICRVGPDYYIATSTFEWYPGVQIHHSTDLVNWTLVARPLNRADLLDMRGNPDSCGVWAPCLSYADGRFWLVYTDVKRLDDLDQIVAVFLRMERPLDYDSVDRQPVDLVFGLFAPKESGVDHLKALALVSRTMRDPGICAKLRANTDPAKLHAILTEARASQAA